MKRRESICECKKYQATNICSEGEWNGSIEGTSGVGDELRKERWDDKKCEIGVLELGLPVAKDQMRHLK
jgi:hypothetical protein